jgi:hypothetical protein
MNTIEHTIIAVCVICAALLVVKLVEPGMLRSVYDVFAPFSDGVTMEPNLEIE